MVPKPHPRFRTVIAETVADVIRSRGGGGQEVRQAGEWAQRTPREAAEAAVGGSATAATAVKIAKQARRLGNKRHGS